MAVITTIGLLVVYISAYILITQTTDNIGSLEYLSVAIFLLASVCLASTTLIYCRRQFELYGDAF